MELLKLIQAKSDCLRRFHRTSLKFLEAHATFEDLDRLTRFQKDRDILIKTLDLLDKKVNEELALLKPSDRTPEVIHEVETELSAQRELLSLINRADEKVLGLLKNEMLKTEVDARAAIKMKKKLGKFKSADPNRSGEGVDRRL